ncbi:MAG: hypothetical protein AAF518_23135 [Spirochaetota bacterium]
MKLVEVLRNIIDKTKFALWEFEEKFSALNALYELHSLSDFFSEEEGTEFTTYLDEFEIDSSLVVSRNMEDSFRILRTSESGTQLLYIFLANVFTRYNGNIEGRKKIMDLLETYSLPHQNLVSLEAQIKEKGLEQIFEDWNEAA